MKMSGYKTEHAVLNEMGMKAFRFADNFKDEHNHSEWCFVSRNCINAFLKEIGRKEWCAVSTFNNRDCITVNISEPEYKFIGRVKHEDLINDLEKVLNLLDIETREGNR